jgi:hypothetical protein
MWKQYAIFFIIFLPCLLLQTSLATIPGWQNRVNIILLLLLGCILFYSFEKGMLLLVISGYILDLYSHLNFGIILLSLCLSLISIYLISKNFINHDSWWSVSILMVLAHVIYNFLIFIFSYICWHFNLNYFFVAFSFSEIISQITISFILIVFVYIFRNFFAKYLIFYAQK